MGVLSYLVTPRSFVSIFIQKPVFGLDYVAFRRFYIIVEFTVIGITLVSDPSVLKFQTVFY